MFHIPRFSQHILRSSRRIALVGLVAGNLLLGACNSQQGNSIRFFALDTPCSITLQGYVPDSVLLNAEKEVRRIEALMSSYRDQSEVSVLNREGQNVLSPETFTLLQQALNYAKQSDGLFDPSIGPLSRLWDITGSRALKHYEDELKARGKLAGQANLSGDASGEGPRSQIDGGIAQWLRDQRKPPSPESIAEALALVSYRDVQLDAVTRRVRLARPGMSIDLGGIAKGFAADRVALILKEAAAPAGVIDLGGNILLYGRKPDGSPWSVGVRGEGENYLLGMFLSQPRAVVTSGIYQRYYMYQGQRYHHILSTHNGYPVGASEGSKASDDTDDTNEIFSVTVIASTSTEADALATLLFFYGPEGGLAEVARRQSQGEDIEALFITQKKTDSSEKGSKKPAEASETSSQSYRIYGSPRFARLSNEQYESLQKGQISSKNLPADRIWLFPLQDSLDFADM